MADLNFLEQLVFAMAEAVAKLEEAKKANKSAEFAKIKSFIFDLHNKLDAALGGNGN